MTGLKSHGQAAMEYLMTYGWALLVIVLVIAVLILINPFSPPPGCRFDQVGFSCNQPIFLNQANGIYVYTRITNSNNNAVKVFKVVCTSDKSSNAPAPPALGLPDSSAIASIPRQGVFNLESAPTNRCYGEDKVTPITGIPAGSDFSGRVWLFYRNEEDSIAYPYRIVSATVTGKVSAAS